jgi:DNA-binding LacI/PurR family transcriptional regulator
VTIDNVDGAFKATNHLIELGHRRIAYIGDRFGLQSDLDRTKGYQKALRKADLPASEELVARGDGKTAGARAAAAKLLDATIGAADRRPTAVFCYNDMSALGVMQEAEAAGLRIPEDLSVVGFDDLFFAAQLRPALTTVRQPKKEIGRRAMNHLLSLLRGEEASSMTLIKGELMVRESTRQPRDNNRPVWPTSRSVQGRTRIRDPRNKA